MNKKDTEKAKKLLKSVVDLGPEGTGYLTQPEIDLIAGLDGNSPQNPYMLFNSDSRDPNDANRIAVRATPAGANFINVPVNVSATGAAPSSNATNYAIIDAGMAEMPKLTRGRGAGAGIKYPFDSLAVNASFFVPNSEDKPNAAKSLSSTINTAQHRYATKTGERTVTRTKRGEGNKALVVNGVKQTETVTLPIYTFEREFAARAVVAGQKYGNWTAPADGALVFRTK